jgi:dolichol-phosphate mannosyltransferase
LGDISGIDLTVVIPTIDEHEDLARLLPQLRDVLASLQARSELLVVAPDRHGAAVALVEGAGGRLLTQSEPGYGGALLTGFADANGEYVLTMDADASGRPDIVRELWESRESADITIASRYMPGGHARMPAGRRVLSRSLNWLFGRALNVPISDLSSGYRLYRRSVLREQTHTTRDFDILQQIIVRGYAEGWKVREIPFAYEPRPRGSSHARLGPVGRACLRSFGELWLLRNSIMAADYDDRAHDSRIYLQRYWQRARHRHVTELIAGHGSVLDVGCGSSRIIGALPRGSVAVDILQRKLRYARKFGRPMVHASGFSLPFADASFPCVLCSQVIEHVPKDSPILDELCRVLAPGGRLVLGTPDYDNWQWVVTEKLYGLVPGGYADEHISHYSLRELRETFAQRGFALEEARYILRGELIMAFRKPAT